tara:strand:+ start:1293 stop:1829 length:537 start_codon:yes stop_codon:yes gene_type:complete
MDDISKYLTVNQSKRPIKFRKLMNAPADLVWNIISEPGNLQKCHPFCKQNPTIEWPGDNSKDEIHYLNGWIFERRFVHWIDHVGYDLFIGRKGGKSSLVSWRIEPINNQECFLSISIYMYKLDFIPKGFRWISRIIYVQPLLKKYLLSVTGGFEYYLQTGKPVLDNHFGSHPWFSNKN